MARRTTSLYRLLRPGNDTPTGLIVLWAIVVVAGIVAFTTMRTDAWAVLGVSGLLFGVLLLRVDRPS